MDETNSPHYFICYFRKAVMIYHRYFFDNFEVF